MKVTKIGDNKKPVYHVAAYCRVSTSMECQQDSFETQCNYYTDLINSTSSWELVGIYADEGRSGTSVKHRPQFMKMVEDARNGKIDIILVKSISRFGRNAVECQEYARELRTLSVEVRFEKEGISNMDPSADFIFSVLAIVAQEESRSIGENVRWTYRKNFEQGIYHFGNNRLLGYDTGSDGKLTPNKDAWIVKRAFEDYAGGMTLKQTADDLNALGAHRLHSDRPFTGNCVSQIIHNEVYVGDLHLQKTAPSDYLTKKPMKNIEYKTYLVKDDHESIISRELWETVKTKLDAVERDLENGLYRSKTKTHYLYGIVYCAECGSPMIRCTVCTKQRGKYKSWECRGRKHKNGCTNPMIHEKELIEVVENTLKERGISTDDIEAAVVKNISRIDVGPEEIHMTFFEGSEDL